MDFGATISRAFNIVLKHRALWILGFLASLVGGVGSAGNSFNTSGGAFTSPSGELSPEAERFFNQLTTDPGLILAGLTGFLCIALLISLVLWVISIMAQGGLIGGVRQIEEEGSTTFGQAWSVGVRKFWPLLGLSLLLALPGLVLLVLFLLLFGGTLFPIFAATVSGDEAAQAAAAGGIFLLICGGGVLGCITLIYAVIAAALQTFGERAIVLENKGVIDALSRGWAVFRSNLGNIILLALLMFVIGVVVNFIVGIIAGLLFAPTLISIIFGAGSEGGVGPSTLILGGLTFLVVVVIGAIISAIFAAFSSAVWTLAYRQFTGTSGIVAEPVAPAPLPTA
ncbi:MAG: hypothetical protein RMN52_10190 [Anaerolineae bacterium]|nr:hypothetical protein [Candidatus Roseilinea sp.]MDW8450364.1 hypothetical protein [Anaerolineae bacterium]